MSKYPNEFAAWRVSFQSDQQAAESAFDDLVENGHELNQLDIELREERRKVERLRSAAFEMVQELDTRGLRSGVMADTNSRLLQALISSEPGK